MPLSSGTETSKVGHTYSKSGVGVQPLASPPRLMLPDAVQACRERTLDRRESGDLAAGVAQRVHVANLGERHQPFVGGVVLGDAVEQVGVPAETRLRYSLTLSCCPGCPVVPFEIRS